MKVRMGMFGFLKKIKNEEGQALVEFALVLPLLLIIVCTIIDFGWVFYHNISINNCSREGARYAVVNSEKENREFYIRERIMATAPDSIKGKLEVEIVFSDAENPSNGDVTVKVTGKIQALTPVAGIFFRGQEITLTSQTTMKVE